MSERRGPHVEATVVRAQRPSSVRPGDTAIVLPDGTIEGFVGGVCAEHSVRLHALRVLETGEPLLLRILPGSGDEAASEGAVTVENPCVSGGGMEVFLQPRLPAPVLLVGGDTPVASALRELSRPLGFELSAGLPSGEESAVVVASHGRDEEELLTAALRAGVAYIGLVASRTRGAAVLGALDATDEQLSRLHTPAGLDIGARTPGEIALAILGEIVAERRLMPPAAREPGGVTVRSEPGASPRTTVRRAAAAPTAIDPVCGMVVTPGEDTPRLRAPDGTTEWFCCDGCRSRYAARDATAR